MKKIEKVDNKEEVKKNSWVKELLPYIIILIVVILIRTFIASPSRVSGPSMEPTLYNGEWLILNKMDKNYKENDVVVFWYENRYLIKRIIGLPGDIVSCEMGDIYVNDIKLEDSYTVPNNICFDTIELGKDEYFVMGDNRNVSYDSRKLGAVNKKQIKGKIAVRIFPFNKIGKIS